MARPIEKTPLIKGNDAQQFQKLLLNSLMPALSVSETNRKRNELREMEKSYQKIVSASNGVFY